jgi:hypothetical protein
LAPPLFAGADGVWAIRLHWFVELQISPAAQCVSYWHATHRRFTQ